MNRQPVWSAAAVTAIVQGLLTVAIATGWLVLPLDRDSFLYVAALVALALPWPFFNAWYVAVRVTSLAEPRDADGCPLVRVDGQPSIAAQKEARRGA